MNEKEPSLLVGWKQIAAYLHCAQSTARRQAREKGLPVFRVGGSVRALAADIDRWLEAQPRTEAEAKEGEEPRALILEGDDLPTALSSLGGRAARLRYALIPLGVKEAEFSRIQELLQSAEEKYQRLVEQVPVWIWETDAAGEFTYSNPRSFEILGYAAGDFAGYAPTEFAVAPEDAERFERSFAAVRESGSVMNGFRCRFVHRDGSRRWLETDAEPALAADGSFAGVRGVSRDVTAAAVAEEELRQHRDRLEELVAARTAELRKVNVGLQREIAERSRVEEALEEQRNRLRTIITVTPDLLILLDRDFVYRAVNPAFCHFTGKQEEELLGRTDFDVFPRSEAEVYRRSDEEVLASGELHILEREVADADGTARWLQVAKAPIFDAAGDIGGLLVSARDITAQKAIEAALRESEEKFRNLAEESPNMIFINARGKVVYANKKCEELMGYTREEFCAPDFDFLALIAPESQDAVKQAFAAHSRGEDIVPYEYTLVTKDGQRIEAIITTKLIAYEGEHAILGIVTDVTERKRAEEALRESEERYRLLADNVLDVILTMDLSLRFTYVSPSITPLLGYSAEEITTLTLEKISTPASFEIAAKTLAEEIAVERAGSQDLKRSRTVELELIRKDGSRIHVEAIAIFLRDPNDKAIGILAVARDITGRRQAERAIKYHTEALRESEEKYRDLFENANDLIQSVTPDGRFLYVNRAWKKALGYDEDELEKLTLFDVIHPDSQDHCREAFGRVIGGERVDNVEVVFVAKDGREVITEGSANCRFKDGEPFSTRGIFRDVTERKRAAEELRESEERLRRIIETAGEGVWLIDRGGKTTFANEQMARMLGYDVDEFLAGSLYDFMDEESRALAAAYMERRREGIREQHDFPFRHKDGSDVWALLEAAPIVDASGEFDGALAMVTDITERKRAEERLRASEERLRALFELSPEAVIVLDPQGTVLDVNANGYAWFGLRREDIVGKKFEAFPFVPDEVKERILAAFARRLAGEEVPPYELDVDTPDGEKWRLRVRGEILRNEQGEVVADLVMVSRIPLPKEAAG